MEGNNVAYLLMNIDYNTLISEKKIQQRTCPLCSSPTNIPVLNLSYNNIIPLNHTFIRDWFNENTISDSISFPIVQCIGCQFVYSKYALTPEFQYSFYHDAVDADASRAKIFKRAKRTQLLAIWSRLHNLAEFGDKQIRVLDFGAGWGDFLAIAKCINVDVFGLEFDVRKIEFARQNGIPSGDFDFINLHAPFDVFMCNQVLEHLANPVESLIQLRGMLRIGAVGYISVPDFSSERLNREIQIIQRGDAPTKDLDPFGHLNYFTADNLRTMVCSAGFEEIKDDSGSPKRPFLFRSVKTVNLGASLYVRAI